MNTEDGIKVQALLDGELSGREAQEVAALLDKDPEARALRAELQSTKGWLSANQPEFRLPEAREFYWSKIERAIMVSEKVPAAAGESAWTVFLRRHLAAIGGSAVAAVVVLFVALQMQFVPGEMFEEIDNPLDETSSFSFRSEAQKMTLVWISSPSVEAEDAEGMPMPVPAPEE